MKWSIIITAFALFVAAAHGAVCTKDLDGSLDATEYSVPTRFDVLNPPVIDLAASGFLEADKLTIVVKLHDRYYSSGSDIDINGDEVADSIVPVVTLYDNAATQVTGSCTAIIGSVITAGTAATDCYSSTVTIEIPWGSSAECGIWSNTPDTLGDRTLRGQFRVKLTEVDGFQTVDTNYVTPRADFLLRRQSTFQLSFEVIEKHLFLAAVEPSADVRVVSPISSFQAVTSVNTVTNTDTLETTITAKVKTSVEWPFLVTAMSTTAAQASGSVTPTTYTASPVPATVTTDLAACNGVGFLDSTKTTSGTADQGVVGPACAQEFIVTITAPVCKTLDTVLTTQITVECNAATGSACPITAATLKTFSLDFNLLKAADLCPQLTDTVTVNGAVAVKDYNPVVTELAATEKLDFFYETSATLVVSATSPKVTVTKTRAHSITIQAAASDSGAGTGSVVTLYTKSGTTDTIPDSTLFAVQQLATDTDPKSYYKLTFKQGTSLFDTAIDQAEFFIITVDAEVEYEAGAVDHTFTKAASVTLQSTLFGRSRNPAMKLMSAKNTQRVQASKGFRLHATSDAGFTSQRLRVSSTSLVALFGGIAMLAVVALVVVTIRRSQQAVVYRSVPVQSQV